MLHVVSGDGAAAGVSKLDAADQVLVWREALSFGPVARQPHGDDFYAARAAFLGGEPEDFAEQRQRLLAALDEGRKVVLWFGRDVFCQIILAALARGLVDAGHGSVRLELVLPGGDEIRCLGGSDSDFAKWFEDRLTITPAELQALATMWDAYADPDPAALTRAIRGTTLGRAHTAMQQALAIHASRFPDSDGLGSDERLILSELDGERSFGDVFRAFCDKRPDFGWGDLQVEAIIADLAKLEDPALTREGKSIRIAARGASALSGDKDLRADGNDIKRNIGGVEVGGAVDWRWDGNEVRQRSR